MDFKYRGRLAPSPTGDLHIGHAYTFWTAGERAQQQDGVLILRNEDLDFDRAKDAFLATILEDLRWLGMSWQEGPDLGGPYAPYHQSQRLEYYRSAFDVLRAKDLVYPCTCSRQDVLRALSAPHEGHEEPVYPGTCRTKSADVAVAASEEGRRINWRFRVPDGLSVPFFDGRYGEQTFIVGKDFGDFVVWGNDVPAYQLAVVADDAAMKVTEVVRGRDLLLSTARQLLLYSALALPSPSFYHCPLVCDQAGVRLAKRHESLTIRSLREQGISPEELKQQWRDSNGEKYDIIERSSMKC